MVDRGIDLRVLDALMATVKMVVVVVVVIRIGIGNVHQSQE